RPLGVEPIHEIGIAAVEERGFGENLVQPAGIVRHDLRSLRRYASLGGPSSLVKTNAKGPDQPFSTSISVWPRDAGDGDTRMPADSIAAILSSAPPLPPEMIAPAWPMRRPGGAVRPAMKPTIGFFILECLMKSAASSSPEPPISPIMMIDSVAGSARNISRMSMNSVPLTGSPPIPTAVVCPKPTLVVWNTAS